MPDKPKWPSGREYEEAIQKPDLFFVVPELRKAAITSDENGIPQAGSGSSASVYQATVGGKQFAIRCFLRNVPGLRKRYGVLNLHLTSGGRSRPPFLLEFAYWEQGILVEGERYPLVRMVWAEGEPLSAWVEAHRRNRAQIEALAETWRVIVSELAALAIAHGDISCDNILVRSESSIALIDYDGCYVSGLEGDHPGEAGHRDFQHPRRADYYGPNMDAFPALVVYLSLRAIAADPALFTMYYDEQNLIFTAADYAKPLRTQKWLRLLGSTDPLVKAMTVKLAKMCAEPVERLPSLSQVLAEIPPGGQASTGSDSWPGMGWRTDPAADGESDTLTAAVPDPGTAEHLGDDPRLSMKWLTDPAAVDATMLSDQPDDSPDFPWPAAPAAAAEQVPVAESLAKRPNWLVRAFRRLFKRRP